MAAAVCLHTVQNARVHALQADAASAPLASHHKGGNPGVASSSVTLGRYGTHASPSVRKMSNNACVMACWWLDMDESRSRRMSALMATVG